MASDHEASSSVAVTTTDAAPLQPQTLEAATAVVQEWADRRAASDYAGVWLLFNEQVRNGISQADYVTLSEACTSALAACPTTAEGVRMDSSEKAITRLEVMGFKVPATVLYEHDQWLLAPEPEFENDLGMPVGQIIAEREARGDCESS